MGMDGGGKNILFMKANFSPLQSAVRVGVAASSLFAEYETEGFFF